MHFYANGMRGNEDAFAAAQDPDDKTLLGMFTLFLGVVALTLVVIMVVL